MVTPHIHPQMEWQQMIDLIVRYDDSLGWKRIDNPIVIREITTTTSQYLRCKTEETLGTTNLTGIEIRNLGNHRRNHLSRTTTGNWRTTTNLKRKRNYRTSHVSTATRKDITPTHAQKKRRLSLPQHSQFSKRQHTERNPSSDRQQQISCNGGPYLVLSSNYNKDGRYFHSIV